MSKSSRTKMGSSFYAFLSPSSTKSTGRYREFQRDNIKRLADTFGENSDYVRRSHLKLDEVIEQTEELARTVREKFGDRNPEGVIYTVHDEEQFHTMSKTMRGVVMMHKDVFKRNRAGLVNGFNGNYKGYSNNIDPYEETSFYKSYTNGNEHFVKYDDDDDEEYKVFTTHVGEDSMSQDERDAVTDIFELVTSIIEDDRDPTDLEFIRKVSQQ